jgi:hypothetical protein
VIYTEDITLMRTSMSKNVKIVETAQGFLVKQGTRAFGPTHVLHELAALLELAESGYVSWRFLGNLEEPEPLDAATEVIQAVGAARTRLQRLRQPEGGSSRA